MSFLFGQKDKRRVDEELVNQSFPLRLTKTEIEWVRLQSKDECSNVNSIIRKSIRIYKKECQSDIKSEE